jgi:quercetin dioxygenase-like cupin family protein
VHAHHFQETRVVVRGELRIGLPETGEEYILAAGDRFDVPPDAPHWVDVNSQAPAVYLIGTKHTNGHK